MEDRRPILSIRNPGHADSEVVRFANGETFLHSLDQLLPFRLVLWHLDSGHRPCIGRWVETSFRPWTI